MGTQRFQKDDPRINRGGRPKGKANKATEDLRIFAKHFLEENVSSIQQSFNKLNNKDKLTFTIKLLKIVTPSIAIRDYGLIDRIRKIEDHLNSSSNTYIIQKLISGEFTRDDLKNYPELIETVDELQKLKILCHDPLRSTTDKRNAPNQKNNDRSG